MNTLYLLQLCVFSVILVIFNLIWLFGSFVWLQLKKYQEYDKKSDKQEKHAQKRKGKATSAINPPTITSNHAGAKTKNNSFPQSAKTKLLKANRQLTFNKGVILLEAAARNDVEEGGLQSFQTCQPMFMILLPNSTPRQYVQSHMRTDLILISWFFFYFQTRTIET